MSDLTKRRRDFEGTLEFEKLLKLVSSSGGTSQGWNDGFYYVPHANIRICGSNP